MDEADCDFPAVAVLAAQSALLAAAWSKRRWRLRSFFVAAEDCAAATREIGRPEMHEDWVVCALVTLGEAQLVVGECVNPMFVDAPCTGIPCNRRCPLRGRQRPRAISSSEP